MCDNCMCATYRLSIAEQKRIIDDLDAAIGDQQAIIGELQTENRRLRGIIAKAGKLCERLTDQMAGAA